MGIPANYKVLFLQGGASSQFAMVPMNLIGRTGKADYFRTGSWSKKAIAEAKRFGEVSVTADREIDGKFTSVPTADGFSVSTDAAYLHYTPNETIEGVEFPYVPDTGDVPLVADMSSTILSRPIDVSQFGLIYAGAQKNIGPAGLTIVIVRDDLIGQPDRRHPGHVRLRDACRMPIRCTTRRRPTAGTWPDWCSNGSRRRVACRAWPRSTSARPACCTTRSMPRLFTPTRSIVDCRSWMNVPFTLANADLDAEFLAQAGAAGLKTLKGHRSVGGMRASIYNAMPEEGVRTLVEFMAEFERTKG